VYEINRDLKYYLDRCRSWDSSAVQRWVGAGWSGVWVSARTGNFSLHTMSKPVLEPTKPPIQWVPGAFSLGVKRPGREIDHLPPSNDEVKNAWIYTSTPQYAFMAWCWVKHSDNFTFITSIGFVPWSQICSNSRIGGVEVQFYVFLTSESDGNEWSASRPDRFTPRKRALGTVG
jgi:hypothetical protein